MKSEHAACHNVYIHDDEQTGKIDRWDETSTWLW